MSAPKTGTNVLGEILDNKLEDDQIRALVRRLHEDSPGDSVEAVSEALGRAAALLKVSQRVSDSLSLEVLLQRIAELLRAFFATEKCTLFLHDPRTDELFTRVSLDQAMKEIRFPSNKGIAGHVFTSGESTLVPDAYADERFNQAVDRETGFKTRNILCVPIKYMQPTGALRIIGVAQVTNKDGEFRSADVGQLEALTTQAAAALSNAMVHEQIAKAREEERLLLEVTTAISTELHLRPLLAKIMKTVEGLLEAERATLFLHDPKTRELCSAARTSGEAGEIRFASDKGIAGSVFTTRETINIPDVYKDDRFNREFDRASGFKTTSMLCMPVCNRDGDVIGVTQVMNKVGGSFSAADEARLGAFSAQVSISIENARLFDEVLQVKNYNESILESMSNGVVTIDADGRVEKVNAAAARLLDQKSPDHLNTRHVSEIFSGDNRWIAEAFTEVRASGRPQVAVDAELTLPIGRSSLNEPSQRQVSINLNAVALTSPTDEPLGCLLVFEDLTKEKRLKSTMARYMSKEVADKLIGEGEEALGGRVQPATVLFSDIRSFTSISERIGPQETVKMLNEYFTLMVDVIIDRGGILDKYIGDAIMAVFGVPFDSGDDADRAVKAAIEMFVKLDGFNRHRQAKGQEPVLIGLGISSDEVLSGNIGSLKRMDFTVIGDGVNLAARLEGANKPYGTQILISEFTAAELSGDYRIREIDRIRVTGKQKPVGVFEVLDYLEQISDVSLDRLITCFEEGLDAYRRRDWASAKALFSAALEARPDDQPAHLYRERCASLAVDPPPPDWDGVWTMKGK